MAAQKNQHTTKTKTLAQHSTHLSITVMTVTKRKKITSKEESPAKKQKGAELPPRIREQVNKVQEMKAKAKKLRSTADNFVKEYDNCLGLVLDEDDATKQQILESLKNGYDNWNQKSIHITLALIGKTGEGKSHMSMYCRFPSIIV